MQTINLDISAKTIIPLLYAKQADVGRKFKAILSDGGAAFPLPVGAAVSIWYSGASGEGNYTDVGANSAVSVSGNEIVVEMIAQMLANYGAGTVCIVIHTAGGDQLGTWNIPYMVEPLPGMGSAAAQAYFTAFSKAVENLPYPDASLSVQGKAADAASVGAALATKAPAGFGLGGACRTTENWDDATACGFWAAYNGLPAEVDGNYHQGIVYQYNGFIYQLVSRTGGSQSYTLIRKRQNDGAWGEWEWDNPPMMVEAVEYRTTERYNGKPVYWRLVDFGYLPNNTAKKVSFGNASCATFFATGITTFGTLLNGTNMNDHGAVLQSRWNEITITTGTDQSAYTAAIFVKYYKLTD